MKDILKILMTEDFCRQKKLAFEAALKSDCDGMGMPEPEMPEPKTSLITEIEVYMPIRIKLAIKHLRKRALLMEAMACYLSDGIKPRKIHYERAIDVMASRGYLGKAAQQAAKGKYICYPEPPRLAK